MWRDGQVGRYLGVAAATAAVALTTLGGSCLLESNTTYCEKTGLRCRQGQTCAAIQGVCIDIGGCGDLVIGDDEVCDDGNIIGGDGCSPDCRSDESCGNGILDPGESCDDGRNDDGDSCSAACVLAACGNGAVDVNEQCDPGAPDQDAPTCDGDCTFIVCGDGRVNTAAGEQCDTGDPLHPTPDSAPNTPACNGPLCKLSACGDRFFNAAAGEECDTGGDSQACNGSSNGSADAHCKVPRCGDRYVNTAFVMPATMTAEACDTGGENTATCDEDCTPPLCGDGVWNTAAGEACDDGNASNHDACVRDATGKCRIARCGDGHLRSQGPDPEQCDDGNDLTTDACPSGPHGTCRPAVCGDGYIHQAGGETCDPGDGIKPQVGCATGETCISECQACT